MHQIQNIVLFLLAVAIRQIYISCLFTSCSSVAYALVSYTTSSTVPACSDSSASYFAGTAHSSSGPVPAPHALPHTLLSKILGNLPELKQLPKAAKLPHAPQDFFPDHYCDSQDSSQRRNNTLYQKQPVKVISAGRKLVLKYKTKLLLQSPDTERHFAFPCHIRHQHKSHRNHTECNKCCLISQNCKPDNINSGK